MIYLHEEPYGNGLVRHWANEISENGTDGYERATHKIKQVETGIVYDEAVDVVPCRYTYEVTDIPIERAETNE